MIRLPATHAAITAPLVAANTRFPGVPIGRSETDGTPFHLSPVLVDEEILPSTNSLALGGFGSGKSTTDKTWIYREILNHGHQVVVIDSFGEDTAVGEWAAVTRSLGGLVVDAGNFTLNPCSPEFGTEVREELIRLLIAVAEPGTLTPQSTHALQHALNNPKADRLGGLIDALVHPEDGRWPAAKLKDWGEPVALALARYTEGSLHGLFDGPGATLPPPDLPIVSFDFSTLDRNSPAIPALMAAITCWIERVWLPQSTAVHRHLVLEEAWQILLNPATAELIQRLLKNSRKAALSLKVIMHTLADLGEGPARDVARLCDIAHVGRLNPEEAAIVGSILNLPAWAIKKIPTLEQGAAVWKVRDFVDVIKTIRSDEEAKLTDTSSRRRKAQEAAAAQEVEAEEESTVTLAKVTPSEEGEEDAVVEEAQVVAVAVAEEADGLHFSLPPNVIDTTYRGPQLDHRHQEAIRAALDHRFNEAADLAAIGEKTDITAYGMNSPQASAWRITQAKIAELSGNHTRAAELRATVARMGNNNGAAWFETDGSPAWQQTPNPPEPVSAPAGPAPTEDVDCGRPSPGRRRVWPYAAAIAAVALASTAMWQSAGDDEKAQADQKKAAAYKGVSATSLTIDGVNADALASWSKDGRHVVLSTTVDWEEKAKLVRIDSAGQTAKEEAEPLEKGQMPMPIRLEVEVPVKNRYQAVRLTVAVGGPDWKEGTRAERKTIEFRPDRTAIDTETGKRLKQQHSL